MENVHELARKIADGGFVWVEDGPTLLEIIDIVNVSFEGILDHEERKDICYKVLDFLDTTYEWDAPRMNEDTERCFYKWMVNYRIRS